MDQETKTEGMGNTEICPMASMCKGMAEKPRFGFLLVIPGLLLVLGGVLIFIEPRVLVWLVGTASILIGVAMLLFAVLIRKMTLSVDKHLQSAVIDMAFAERGNLACTPGAQRTIRRHAG